MLEASTDYSVRLQIDRPAQSSRGLALCSVLMFFPKLLFAIPHMFVLAIVGWAGFFVAWAAQVVVLFTGEYPAGMHAFVAGTLRWQSRVNAWIFGLVDRYPPFTLR